MYKAQANLSLGGGTLSVDVKSQNLKTVSRLSSDKTLS